MDTSDEIDILDLTPEIYEGINLELDNAEIFFQTTFVQDVDQYDRIVSMLETAEELISGVNTQEATQIRDRIANIRNVFNPSTEMEEIL